MQTASKYEKGPDLLAIKKRQIKNKFFFPFQIEKA